MGYNAKHQIFGPTLEFFGSNYGESTICMGLGQSGEN